MSHDAAISSDFDDVSAGRRVPKTTMFRTAVSAILSNEDALHSKDPGKGFSEKDVKDTIQAIIARRLRKIESLQAHLRRSMLTRLPAISAGASTKVVHSDGEESDTWRAPVTRLSTQQALVMGG